jgi:hypothetical protein
MATLQELIDEQRGLLDDEAKPCLWSDVELLRYNNKAVDRLATDAFLISDAATAAVCQVSLTLLLGAHYTKHAKIVKIRECRLTGYTIPMTRADLPWLQSHFPTWQSMDPANPRFFSEDLTSGKISFIPAPDAAYTANLIVYRRPLTTELLALSTAGLIASPIIDERYHKYILNGVLAQAYGKQDAETFDRNLQVKHEVLFKKDLDKAFNENMQTTYSNQTVSLHRGFTG